MKNFEEMNATEIMETNGGFFCILPVIPFVVYATYEAYKTYKKNK